MLYHCGGDGEENHTYDFTIKVDSVVYPKSVLFNDTISLKFYGQIGTWESQVLREIEIHQYGDSVKIRVVGTELWIIDHRKSTYLNGEERKILASQRGMLYFVVQQPAGVPNIEGSILVN